jgi:hypothetical protein
MSRLAAPPPALPKAASGAKDQQTLRFVAAGKLWAALTNDVKAEILQRRNVGADSLARALEIVANSVRELESDACDPRVCYHRPRLLTARGLLQVFEVRGSNAGTSLTADRPRPRMTERLHTPTDR